MFHTSDVFFLSKIQTFAALCFALLLQNMHCGIAKTIKMRPKLPN